MSTNPGSALGQTSKAAREQFLQAAAERLITDDDFKGPGGTLWVSEIVESLESSDLDDHQLEAIRDAGMDYVHTLHK